MRCGYSATDWGAVANTPAKVRVRIRPTPDTLRELQYRRYFYRKRYLIQRITTIKQRMQTRKALRLAQEKEMAELAAARAALSINLPAKEGSSDSLLATESNKTPTVDAKPDTAPPENGPDKPVAPSLSTKRNRRKYVFSMKTKAAKLQKQYNRQLEGQFIKEFGLERSWMSQTVSLLPGTYIVSADVSFSVPELALDPYVNSLIIETNAHDVSTVDKASALVSAVDDAYNGVLRNTPWKEMTHLGTDDNYTPKVYLQWSSCTDFELSEVTNGLGKEYGNPSLENVVVTRDTWPLTTECQSEAASRGLSQLLTQLRKNALQLRASVAKKKAEEQRLRDRLRR